MKRVFSVSMSVLLITVSVSARSAELKPLISSPGVKDKETAGLAELGKKLFFDRRLSGDGTTACATCHDPERGYGDGLQISQSYPTTRNWRNAQTLINVGLNRVFFWDGRVESLEEQALFPIMSAFEMNQNLDYLEEELREVPEYALEFKQLFGGEVTRERIGIALAAFQRTIVSTNAPVDRFLAGDERALTVRQREGYEIFVGKGGCATCHNGANLSDNEFYNLGVPEDPKFSEDPRVSATRRFTAKTSGYADYRTLKEDPGRFLVTKNKSDWKAFRTPTLREVARTGPYMHNGAFRTLKEVIDFFDRGGGDVDGKTSPLVSLGLSNDEKEALEAFLTEALSGDLPEIQHPDVP